jgi:hypothetical protein
MPNHRKFPCCPNTNDSTARKVVGVRITPECYVDSRERIAGDVSHGDAFPGIMVGSNQTVDVPAIGGVMFVINGNMIEMDVAHAESFAGGSG